MTASHPPRSASSSCERKTSALQVEANAAAASGCMSLTATSRASPVVASASTYARAILPAPTSPNRMGSTMAKALGQYLMLSIQRISQIIDVLLLVSFIPWQHEHLLEETERPGKPRRVVIDRFRARQGEGI